VNVDGSARVFEAAAAAGVPALVYSSSVGAYAPGSKADLVSEEWPVTGIPTSTYSAHKAEVERMLDAHEQRNPRMRVVRIRPGLVFKRSAATEIRRLFLGPLFPNRLLRKPLIPVLPLPDELCFQAVHSDDLAAAFRLAVVRDEVTGPYNVAAEPTITPQLIAKLLGARKIAIPAIALRRAVALAWRARGVPTDEGWIDLALGVPLMRTDRIRELGWRPRRTSEQALEELLGGLREGADGPTPPLSAATTSPLRLGEFRTGIGAKAL
jgi:nucleoside-diphosphate-sugar epimerase